MELTRDNRTARSLRLAGALTAGGMLAALGATAFHPARANPNDHPAAFAEYANADAWVADHIAQFAAGLVVFAGLVVLFCVLRAAQPGSVVPWIALGAAMAGAAGFAVLQATDGVALKHAVDTWVDAPAAKRASAFADAELVRALEWGANAFFRLLQGAAVGLFGFALARTSVAPRWLGWVGVAAGIGYAATGAVVATHGFSGAALALSLATDPLFLVFAVGLLAFGHTAIRRSSLAHPIATGRVPGAVR